MRLSTRHFIPIITALALALATYFIWPRSPRSTSGATPTAMTPLPPDTPPPAPPTELFLDPDLPLTAKRLQLLQLDRDEARAWILSEIESGADHATGDDLELGADQNLTAWPSYRVYLLDLLFQVDPDLAAAKSRELVENSQSPDEWAVALRNVAMADREGFETSWLRERATELLRNDSWKAAPSAGFLNAFDVIVHTRHTTLTPDLMALADDTERKAVRHAAFLALDRLVQVSPDEMLPILARSAKEYRQSGPMLSNLMARADVREEGQRAALETYLLDTSRTEEELTSFVQVFPNANFHISNNLLTKTEGIEGITLAERDRASLELIREWLEDERFARIHPALRIAHERLRRFVEG